jgi:predicted lipoprotein with Yx(FWY)xxD motif
MILLEPMIGCFKARSNPAAPAWEAALEELKPRTRTGRASRRAWVNRGRFNLSRTFPRISRGLIDELEVRGMQRTQRDRSSGWRTALGRFAAATLIIGGLSAVVFAPAMAGAVTPSPRTASEISTAKDAKVGTFLVAGNAVYTLKASKIACTAQCLKAWPPVLLPQGVMTASAGTGVDASKLGTKPTADGPLQLTYSGKPLYWFVKDKAPGDVKGNVTDKWGKWATVVTVKSSSGSKGGTNAGTGGSSF